MEDFNYQKLSVGDNIMFVEHLRTSIIILRGTIIGFTKCFAIIEYFTVCGEYSATKSRKIKPKFIIKYV